METRAVLELVALSVEARFVDEDVGVGGDACHRAADVIANLEERGGVGNGLHNGTNASAAFCV